MEIKTKYEIGARIWVIIKKIGVVEVFDDFISYVTIDDKNGLLYVTREATEELKEEDVIPYEDKEMLHTRLCNIMLEIRKDEEENNTEEVELISELFGGK